MATAATLTSLDDYKLTDVSVTNKKQDSNVKILQLEYKGTKCNGRRIHKVLLDQAIRCLGELKHPNVTQFLGVCFLDGDKVPTLVMEFLPMTLTSCIKKHRHLPDDINFSILHDIALGLYFLHTQTTPIIHGNLSPNNIHLTSNFSAKISSLGITWSKDHEHNYTSVDIRSYSRIVLYMFSKKNLQSEPETECKDPIPAAEHKSIELHLTSSASHDPVMDFLQRCMDKSTSAKDIMKCTSKLSSKYLASSIDPVELIDSIREKDGVELKTVGEEMDKILQEQQIHHPRQLKELQQQIEHLKIATKQPLQATIAWKQCKSPPTNVAAIQSTVICGKVYFGGGDATNNNIVYCYDPSKDDWNALPKLPVRDFGLGQINGKLVAVGGVNTKTNKCSSEIYTLADNKWESKLPCMSTARSLVAVVSLDSGLLVAGGQTDKKKNTDKGANSDKWANTNRVELFKLETSQWYNVPQLALPMPSHSLSLTVSGDSLYLTGGYNDQQCGLNDTWSTSVDDLVNFAEYDVVYRRITTNWKQLQSTPAYTPLLAVLSGSLVAIGGCKTDVMEEEQTRVYKFSPSMNCWIYIVDLPEPLTWSVSATLSPTETFVIGQDKRNKENKMYKSQLSIQHSA